MLKHDTLPSTIPLFPLQGALLLPRTRLPLNVFEPRFLTMVEDVLKTPDRLIGMVQPIGAPAGKSQSNLHRIGSAGRITSFSESEDGRYMITLAGVSRFRISERTDSEKPYISANVDWSPFAKDLGPKEIDEGFDRPAFLKTLEEYFETMSLSTDWGSLREADEELLVNTLAMLCPFEDEEKQVLLEAQTLANRRETLTALMEFANRMSVSEKSTVQ